MKEREDAKFTELFEVIRSYSRRGYDHQDKALQIIAGTLEPTHGGVWREGRVAALLELSGLSLGLFYGALLALLVQKEDSNMIKAKPFTDEACNCWEDINQILQ